MVSVDSVVVKLKLKLWGEVGGQPPVLTLTNFATEPFLIFEIHHMTLTVDMPVT